MTTSTTSRFAEPADYLAALGDHGEVELVVIEPAIFRARLARIILARMSLAAADETVGRVAWVKTPASQVRISLPVPGGGLIRGGVADGSGDVIIQRGGEGVHERSTGPCRWRTISCPDGELRRYGRAVVGPDFNVPAGVSRWRPPARALRRLTDMHDDAMRAAATRPQILTSIEAARGLEQDLLGALLACLEVTPAQDSDPATVRRADIVARFEALLQQAPEATPSVVALSAALSVSERFLETICTTHLGMGPRRYMILRRMQAARRVLRDEGPYTTRVRAVAARFGFGHPGRFAASYRVQFGEAPSATLRRLTGDRSPADCVSGDAGPHGVDPRSRAVAEGAVALAHRRKAPRGTVLSSSAVEHFADADAYAATFRGSDAAMTVLGRGAFDAAAIRIDLGRLWMQGFSETVPRTLHIAGPTARDVIYFATPGSAPLCRNGEAMESGSLVRMALHQDSFQRSDGPVRAASMSLPAGGLRAMAAAITGCDPVPPRDEVIVTPRPAAMATLQRLHAAARSLAENAPEVIANAEAARGLEQALIEAMVGCLSAAETVEESAAQRRHETIMQRFHAALEDRPDEAVYVPDLCARIGASQRTLEVCCHESLGVSPKRYLLLRRLTQARKALTRDDPHAATVTTIAADCGFWHFGRFAAEYKAVYGESPSSTLRQRRP